MANIYSDGSYLKKNPDWHLADAKWKADQLSLFVDSQFIDSLPNKTIKILDFGCGAGGVLKYFGDNIKDKIINVTYSGYEVSNDAIELLTFHYLMDTMYNLCYHKGYAGGHYETPWQTPNVGKAAASGRPFVETRSYLSLGSARIKRFFKLRGALAPDLPEEGPKWVETDSKYRTASAFVEPTEENLGGRLGEGATGSRLPDGSLDAEAYRSDNSEEFSSALLHRESLEADGRPWLELPETAEEGQGAPGRSDSLLETSRLAAYKKTPLGLEPAWPSWMRADSRLFQISREPGRSKEKLQSSLSPDAGLRYRPSLPSRSLQKENGLDFTRGFMPIRTSGPNKSDSSSDTWRATSRGLLFFSGTEARSTEPSSSSDSLEVVLESIPFASRDTRLRLIPMNLSGQTSSEIWQTASPETLNILDGSLIDRLESSGIPRDSYDPAFTHRTYRGHDVYPLFNENSVAKRTFPNLNISNGEPFSSGEVYDIILAVDILEHLAEPNLILRKLIQHACWMILHVPLDDNMWGHIKYGRGYYKYLSEDRGHLHYFNKRSAIDLLKNRGLKIKKWTYTFWGTELNNDGGISAPFIKIARKIGSVTLKDLSVYLLGGASLAILASTPLNKNE